MRSLRWAVFGLTALALGACSAPESERPPMEEPLERISPLEREFIAASDEFGVPVDLMKAVSWVESRWSTPPLPGDDHAGHEHGHSFRAYGIMGLRDGDPWRTLQRASLLTGLDEGQLTFDRGVNIRGAAAVLRSLAEEGAGGAVPRGAVVEVWAEAVGRYGGGDDVALQARFRRDVFSLLISGMRAQTEEGLPMRIGAAGSVELPTLVTRGQAIESEYPGARFDQAHSSNFSNQSRSRSQVTHIAVHVTQGSYSGAISWFKNSSSNVSAHYVVRSSDGDITQMVLHEDKAWHIGSANPYTIGIEHEGFISEPRWFTDEMYRSSAALTRHIAETWSVPLDREHIKGHVEFPNQTHTDPGQHWDWNRYMALVKEEDAGPVKGNMVGYVREGDIYDTDAPLAGALVALGNGRTATTDNNGFYRINDLDWGVHSITASLDGYRSATIERALDVRFGDSWASLALVRAEDQPPVVETGALVGLVNDGSAPLGGVLVEAGGLSVASDERGEFRLEGLEAARLSVRLSKAGHASLTVDRVIEVGGETWLGVSLPPEGGKDPMIDPDPGPSFEPDPVVPQPEMSGPIDDVPVGDVAATQSGCGVVPVGGGSGPVWGLFVLVGLLAVRLRR